RHPAAVSVGPLLRFDPALVIVRLLFLISRGRPLGAVSRLPLRVAPLANGGNVALLGASEHLIIPVLVGDQLDALRALGAGKATGSEDRIVFLERSGVVLQRRAHVLIPLLHRIIVFLLAALVPAVDRLREGVHRRTGRQPAATPREADNQRHGTGKFHRPFLKVTLIGRRADLLWVGNSRMRRAQLLVILRMQRVAALDIFLMFDLALLGDALLLAAAPAGVFLRLIGRPRRG